MHTCRGSTNTWRVLHLHAQLINMCNHQCLRCREKTLITFACSSTPHCCCTYYIIVQVCVYTVIKTTTMFATLRCENSPELLQLVFAFSMVRVQQVRSLRLWPSPLRVAATTPMRKYRKKNARTMIATFSYTILSNYTISSWDGRKIEMHIYY